MSYKKTFECMGKDYELFVLLEVVTGQHLVALNSVSGTGNYHSEMVATDADLEDSISRLVLELEESCKARRELSTTTDILSKLGFEEV